MICMEAELFAIPRGGGVGLPDGDVLHPDPAIGALFQPRVGLIVEILGQVFRRRIDGGERLQLIHHLVVEIIHHRAQTSFRSLKSSSSPAWSKVSPLRVTRTR